MKKRILLLIFLLVNFIAFEKIKAQTDTIYFNNNAPAKTISDLPKPKYQPTVFKTSPTAFFIGGVFPFTSEYRFVAEIPTARTQSDQVAISYLGKNVLLSAIERNSGYSAGDVFKVSGWRFQYAHKFYLIKKKKFAPYGFYVAPHFSYANARVSLGLSRHYSQTYYDFKHFNANIMFGVQGGKVDRLTIDIYGGFGYKSNKLFYQAGSYNYFQLDTKDFGDLYNMHLNIIFGINLGYSI